jgi:hypothetical protein
MRLWIVSQNPQKSLLAGEFRFEVCLALLGGLPLGSRLFDLVFEPLPLSFSVGSKVADLAWGALSAGKQRGNHSGHHDRAR